MASGKKVKRIHRGRAFWEATVAEFNRSGLSQGAFARMKKLKPSTLGRWIKKLDSQEASAPSQFMEVVASPVETSWSAVATRVRVGSAAVEFSDLPPMSYVAGLLREVATC